jgi:hypothetical protein
MDAIDLPMPESETADDKSEKAFAGHRAITVAVGIAFWLVFGVAMAFDVAFLPLFIPSLLFFGCWFKSYRTLVPVDAFFWYFGMGFLAFGFGIVVYQLFVSFLFNGIVPHDSTLSQKYVLSNFLYSFIGGGLGSEVGRYLISKKIRVDRKDSEISPYLFSAMAGNVGTTAMVLILGNTGSLLKRVDTKIVETFLLGKAVLVRSILDSILQLLLAYRLEMTILRRGYYNKQSAAWNATFAVNIIIRGISDFCFFVVGLMQGSAGAGGLSGIYIALIIIVALIVRSERKFLNFAFDSSLGQPTTAPGLSAEAAAPTPHEIR